MNVIAKPYSGHTPVLVAEVLHFLDPHPDTIYVDCTLGEGGHTQALLQASAPTGRVIGIDRDVDMLQRAREKLKRESGRIVFCLASFHHLPEILQKQRVEKVDGILFDLGISSFHLAQPERGFSFQLAGPLDMRINRTEPVTAAELVNTLSQDELDTLLRTYGEERWAKQIARTIIQRRKLTPIVRTEQLVDCILAAIPPRQHTQAIHPATRTFQALRIAVNKELQILHEGLTVAIECLKPRGRIGVISFHSLEDRIVKNIFRMATGVCRCPPKTPCCVCGCEQQKKVTLITKKPVVPTPEEVAHNPRARSAKLRVAERI